jgi:hypothetical protein
MPPLRLVTASATLLVLALASDCAWQRVHIPRLTGLEGRYYPNLERRGEAALTAIDSDIATETLDRRRREIHADAFSVAWTGRIEIPASGEHAFFVRSGGRLTLLVDGAVVAESRSRGVATGSVQLSAGLHELQLLYAQGAGEASLALAWARDGQPRQPLSGEHLLPPRPDWPAIGAYRAGRTVLRGLAAASLLIAIAATVAAAAVHGLHIVRAGPGRAVAAGCLAALLLTGGLLLDDFGVSFDENSPQRELGILNYLYLTQGATGLFDPGFPERNFGPAFEIFLVAIEKQLGLADSRAVFLVRHGVTFLFFCLGVSFFYLLCLRHFGRRPLALFACALLVTSPRIFADAFYNSKDIPALSKFVICVYTLVRLLDEWTARRAIWHALASALLIDIRIVGVFVPAMTLLLGAGDLLFAQDRGRPRGRRAAVLASYGVLLTVFTVAFCPFLWRNTPHHFLALFDRIPFSRTVLYLGQHRPATGLPWHYLPVWIAVTTPLAYLALIGAGLLGVARSWPTTLDGLFGRPDARNRLIWALWGFGPVASVVLTKALVYDGWRHVFFVYPGLVIIAVEGARWIARRGARPGGRGAVALAAAACLLVFAEPVWFMVRHHPHENVFFNRLAGDGMRTVRDRFEVDYWGLSYRRGLEYVLRHDGRPSVNVLLRPGAGDVSAAILPSADRRRLAFVDRGRDAEYYLGNYRWHRGEYPFRHEVYSVRIGDASIMSVYDLRFDRWVEGGSTAAP